MKSNGTSLADARIPPPELIPDELFTDLLLLWPCAWLIICSFGLWANGLVIRTFIRMGLHDSITISFFCLGLSDFAHDFCPLLSIVVHVLEFMEVKFRFIFRIQSLLMYFHVTIFASTFNNLTMFITTFLALQRCLCIVKALHFKGMFSRKRTWCIMGCFTVTSTVFTVTFSTSFGVADVTNPYTNTSQYVITMQPWWIYINDFVATAIFTVCPIVSQGLVFGSVIVMSYGLKASMKFRQDTSSVNTTSHNNRTVDKRKPTEEREEDMKQNPKERTAIVQVFLLSTIFLVTNLPKILLALGQLLIPSFRLGTEYENTYRMLLGMRLSSDYLNSAVNFFIYYKYNSRFRKVCFASNSKIVKETK